MAWSVDQSGLNHDSIYYRYHSADPSPLPFVPLPQLPDLGWGSHTDAVHPLGCYPPDCLSCPAMPASAPSPWVALTGPNPDHSDHSDPTAAISASHQSPVEGSVHQEPKSRSQKKKKITRQTPDHLSGAPLQCKWEVAAIRATSTVSTNLSDTYRLPYTSLP